MFRQTSTCSVSWRHAIVCTEFTSDAPVALDDARSRRVRCYPLTHEYLAIMLGTNRSGVTIAVGILQQAGVIRSALGTISVLDRNGLENASCECYEVAREQFGGLLRR
ncbi:helix-turn-helix domain-containing protein [Vulcanimicrobium alpinum]|uniref:helix-turn-helix domain-containing protein n=1 Tax=Vulcanimicrobium alpinum TaxID=3016050 RepID=UPI00386EA342